MGWSDVHGAETGILPVPMCPHRLCFCAKNRNFAAQDVGNPLRRPRFRSLFFQRPIITKYINIGCLCVQAVGRIVLVPHCLQEQRRSNFVSGGQTKTIMCVGGPMNDAKIRDFRHETFHAHLLSSEVSDAIVRKAEHCWGLRTRHRSTWWDYVVFRAEWAQNVKSPLDDYSPNPPKPTTTTRHKYHN